MNEPLRACPTCATPVDSLAGGALGRRDYRWVADALPGRVAPMDLDLVLERNGRVLIHEEKPAGAPLSMGQRLTLRTFVRMGCDVWLVWADKEDDKYVHVGAMDKNGQVKFVERMTERKLRTRTAQWFEEAGKDE